MEIDEGHPTTQSFFAHYHLSQGAFREALPFAEKAYLLTPHWPQSAGVLAGLLVRSGDPARADAILSKFGPPTAFGVPRGLALFHLVTGEIEKADWYERAIEQRDGMFPVISAFPPHKPLRESPRWPKLAKIMGLPEGA